MHTNSNLDCITNIAPHKYSLYFIFDTTGLYSEKMDRGALGLVFRLSRLVGIAPVVRDNHAGHYRVSTPLLIYGAVIVTCAGIYTVETIMVMLQNILDVAWRTTDVMNILYFVAKMVILVVGIATASERMIRMATHLEQLDHDNSKSYGRQNFKLRILVVLYISVCVILRTIEFSSLATQAFQKKWSGIAFLLMTVLKHHVADLLIIQMALFAKIVLITTENVNDSLLKMLPHKHFLESPETGKNGKFIRPYKVSEHTPIPAWEDKDQNAKTPYVNIIFNRSHNSTHAFSNKVNCESFGARTEQPLQHTIRRLASNYSRVCDIIMRFNTSDGFIVILLLSSSVLYMEKYLYKIMLWQWLNKPYDMTTVMSMLWCVILSAMLICIVEPFHRTHAQMFKTHMLVNILKNLRWDDLAVINELDTFVQLLMLRNPIYSPLGVITINRSLLVKILLKVNGFSSAAYESALKVVALKFLFKRPSDIGVLMYSNGNPHLTAFGGCLVSYLVIMLTYGLEVREFG